MNSEIYSDEKVYGLDQLEEVLNNKMVQNALVVLYSQSQAECTKNGVCGMEIGMSREKDLCAVLKMFLKDKINLDISNTLPEDLLIINEKVSIKHSSSKVGTPIKAKWTSADISTQDDIKSIINADDSYYPHLLLIYIDTKLKTITIICISSKQNRQIIKELKEDAFKIPKGNSRGIEYSKKAMEQLLKNRYFTITIENADIKTGINPIDRRINYLQSIGINS
jgi:hypothetical protein